MMPELKKKSFIKSGEGAIASYDYVDVAEGTGIRTFYAAVSLDSTGTKYFLTKEAFRSSSIESGATGVANVTMNTEFDFDLTAFNSPQTLKGTATVTFSLHHVRGDAGAEGYVQAIIRKWDGTTETTLVTAQTETYTADVEKNVTLRAVVPETVFKAGEILRLTMRLYHTNGASGGSKFYFGTDPYDQDGTYLTPSTEAFTTQLKFHAPFKIEL